MRRIGQATCRLSLVARLYYVFIAVSFGSKAMNTDFASDRPRNRFEKHARALSERLAIAKSWHSDHKFALWVELAFLVCVYLLIFNVQISAPAVIWVASVALARLSKTKEWHRVHKSALWIEILSLPVLYALYFLLGWFAPDVPLFAWIASIIMAAFAGFYLYLVLEFLTVIGWMWVPAAVTAIACCLLFLSDQGLDLGVALLGAWKENSVKYFLLAPVLFYWAFASWHAGRRSLDRRFPTFPALSPNQMRFLPWLRWPPRLLGICAHLFAAINLCLAVSGYLKARGEFLRADWTRFLTVWVPLELITWGPVIIIVIGVIYLWSVDYSHLSSDSSEAPIEKRLKPIVVTTVEAVFGTLLVTSLLIFVGACAIKNVPRGFLPASISIFASAAVFLAAVIRTRPDGMRDYAAEKTHDTRRLIETALLFGAAVFGSIAALGLSYFCPLWLGDRIGSMILAFFAFGAIVSVIDAFSLPLDFYLRKARLDTKVETIWNGYRAAQINLEQFVSGYVEVYRNLEDAKIAKSLQRLTLPVVCGFLVLIAATTSWIRTYDDIRMCKDKACLGDSPANAFSLRPTVDEAVDAWYDQAKAAWEKDDTGSAEAPIPLVIVAAAGGGIRAAYWTATVLESLRDEFSRRLPKAADSSFDRLRPYLFAISSVSGGSLGAAAYSATLLPRADVNSIDPEQPTKYLEADFLAPALVSMIFHDSPANLLPTLWGPDRGVALERSFEAASNDKLGKPFLSFFPRLKPGDEKDTAKDREWRPILLFNATHQKTGRRIIQSPILIEKDIFADAYDALNLFQSDTRMSTAVLDSARFLYISPPGRMPAGRHGENRGYIIDGGYYENFGAQTALELVQAVERSLANKTRPRKVRLFVLQISSDPSMRASARPRISGTHGTCEVSTAGLMGPQNLLEFEDAPFDYATWSSKGDDEGPEVNFVNELWSPLAGVMSTRESRGRAASEELAEHMCSSGPGDFYHLAMCDPGPGAVEAHVVPPLGWVLSPPSRAQIRQIGNLCGNSEEMKKLLDGMVPATTGRTASRY